MKRKASKTAHTYRKRIEPKKRIKPGQRVRLDAPLKIVHDWVADREIHEPHIVLRIDDYNTEPADRGQFYPTSDRSDDKQKAIWPNQMLALQAAEWAAKQFGRQYGVFKMTAIVETATRPTVVWEL